MGRPSKYDREFKVQAVQLVLSSKRSRSVIAAELGLSEATLGRWMSEHADGQPEELLTVTERAELLQLRAERRDWLIEREILKKNDGLVGERAPLMKLYKFIDAHRASYEIRQLCQALRVNESSYFYWNSVGRAAAEARALEAEALTAAVRAVFATSDATYGAVEPAAGPIQKPLERCSTLRSTAASTR